MKALNIITAIVLVVAGFFAPQLLPSNMTQLTDLVVFIMIALAWDMLGGQMGYNSFGNVFFFGIGMYLAACTQVIFAGYDLAAYTSAQGGNLGTFVLTPQQFLTGFFLGLVIAGIVNFLLGLAVGSQLLQMRGHYFAIATLGLGVAAAEFARAIPIIGAGSGMNFVQPPDGVSLFHLLYYTGFFIAVVFFIFLNWLYSTRYGSVMNAIRDSEEKSEAMGLPTARIKTLTWAMSAFIFGVGGAIYGAGKNFIDPAETAFAGATVGVWMVLMPIMGGMGTLWGPVIGAIVFQLFKEFFWTYLFGWQRVALGLLIVIIVVFFPYGIMGGLKSLRQRMGWGTDNKVDEAAA